MHYTICPRHRPLLGRFYRAAKSSQATRPAVEVCFLFGKNNKLLLSDRVSVISFPGFGYFFLNRELISIVRLPIYMLLHLIHIWIFGWGNPYPPSENLPKCSILGSYGAIKRPFSSRILGKRRSLHVSAKSVKQFDMHPFYVIRSFPRVSLP